MEKKLELVINSESGEHICTLELDDELQHNLIQYAVKHIFSNVSQNEIRKKQKYYGITYQLPSYQFILKIWKKLFCKYNWHLFDEVETTVEPYHYLYCDACGLTVIITYIEEEK